MRFLLLLPILIAGCTGNPQADIANYNSHVSARQVALQGTFDKTTNSGSAGVNYRVEYGR